MTAMFGTLDTRAPAYAAPPLAGLGEADIGDSPPVAILSRMEIDAALLVRWSDLAAFSSEPNAFNAPWFLPVALRHYDQKGQVRLFTLWAGEPKSSPLLAVLPMIHTIVYGAHPVPNLTNWMHYNAFLGTPMVREGFEDGFWRALLRYADGQPRQSLFLHIEGLAAGGKMEQSLLALCAKQHRRCDLVKIQERAFLQSPLSPEAYFEATVRSKKRKELRRQSKRLEEMGVVEFRRSDGREGLDDWIEDFLALEAAGWKGFNQSAIGSHSESRIFFAETLHAAAQFGALELLEYRFDGRAVAMLVNFLTPPGSFSFKTAFDEAFSRFSPGVLLQIRNLEILNRSDIDWMDSCAAQDHPMIDSLWAERRSVARYSIAIGGPLRRAAFGAFRFAEQWRARRRTEPQPQMVQS